MSSTSLQGKAALMSRQRATQGAIERLQRIARAPLTALALVLVLGCAAYAAMLNDWFQTDDFIYIRVAQLDHSPDFLLHTLDFRDNAHRTTNPVEAFKGRYQPLYELTIISQAKAFKLHAWPYHAVSLAVHLANGALLWLIAMKMTKRALVAHLSALVFVLHPTLVPAVGWISDQVGLTTTTANLLCVFAFIKALEPDGKAAGRWYAISVAGYLASMLFHPKGAMILAPLGAYYFFVHSADARRLLSPAAWLRMAPFLAVAMLPFALDMWLQNKSPSQQETYRYGSHIYTNYMDYLRMSLVPDGWLRSADWVGPLSLFAWLGIGAWLLAASRFRAPTVVGLAWLLSAIFPLTLFTWGAFNRELYVVGPAVALLLALLAVSLLDRLPKLPAASVVAAGALVLMVALVMQRTIRNEDVFAVDANQSHAFTEQLLATYPTLPEGTLLYTVDTPPGLRLFGDIHLNALGQVYYGDIKLKSVSSAEADAIARSQQPNAVVFRYRSR